MFDPSSGAINVGTRLELLSNLYTTPYGAIPEYIVPKLQWSIVGGTASTIDLTSRGVVTGINPTKADQPVQIQVKYLTINGDYKTAVYTLTVLGAQASGDNRY